VCLVKLRLFSEAHALMDTCINRSDIFSFKYRYVKAVILMKQKRFEEASMFFERAMKRRNVFGSSELAT
jgi:hypothetical protein